MIQKTGTVKISGDDIIIRDFEFKDVVQYTAQQEAIKWAIDRLTLASSIYDETPKTGAVKCGG